MYAYMFRRVLAVIPVMAVVAIFVFSLLHLTPGDAAAMIAGDNASSADIARIRDQLGLDLPLHIQFFTWMGSILTGDLGTSIYSDRPVMALIAGRIEPTLALAVCTMVFAIVLAIPMGIIAAWKVGTWIDRSVMILAVLGFSVPVFVIGYVLIFGFALQWRIFPVQGYRPISDGLYLFFLHLVLPTVALGVGFIALIARMTRASMLEVLGQDYIRTAHAKGLGQSTILMVHALKNASVPIATIIGVGVALLIGGVVITETVFALPGLGRLTVDSILRRDYPVIQGLILIFSAVYVLVNLMVDLLYTVLDPRIRY